MLSQTGSVLALVSSERIKEEDLKECSQKASQIQKKLLEDKDESRVLGWRTLEESAVGLDVMRKKAEEIRKMADVFVIVGVGGSNQAARAMIEALKEERKGPEILYLGNTLSPYTISHTLEKLEGKRILLAEDNDLNAEIAMTANAFEEDRKRALEVGMDGYIAKPIHMESVLDALQEGLAGKH